MAKILKNKNLEIHIDFPRENYHYSRFDWTGKIVKVKFQNVDVSGIEKTDGENEHQFGKGFYNEFGIDTPLGFDDTETGDWFHKIGVGLLKKDDDQYLFCKKYQIKPSSFKMTTEANKVTITCHPQTVHGYSYLLKKEIELFESSFLIRYYLHNTGEKTITTDEYIHNFLSINKDPIGKNYILRFPFQLQPELFGDTVNPEGKINIGRNEIKISRPPEQQFFFSNLTGGKIVDAGWELINLKSKIGISENGSFQTNKVNLWGWKHVISPELFFHICIKPGQSTEWHRKYNVYHLK